MDVSIAESVVQTRCAAHWELEGVAAANIEIDTESTPFSSVLRRRLQLPSGEEYTEMAMSVSVWMATDSRPLKRQIRRAKRVSDYAAVFALIEQDAAAQCSACAFEIVMDDDYASVDTELMAKNKINAQEEAVADNGSSEANSGGLGTTGILSVILVLLVVLIASVIGLWCYVKRRAKDKQGLGARTFQHSMNSQKSMGHSAIDKDTLFGTLPQTQTHVVAADSEYAETEQLGQSYGAGAGALDL